MKVCTDACLFGAWVAEKLEQKQIPADSILDIGAGTGLLSLILAQKTNARIEAIEIEQAAATQATENFKASRWSDRLHVTTGDAAGFRGNKQFDLVISNPPFFENDLMSPDGKRNLAMHATQLGFEGLIDVVKRNLSPEGKFAVLLPFHRHEAFLTVAAKQNFFPLEKMNVRQTEKHAYFRTMLLLSREKSSVRETDISIRRNNVYSEAFTSLLKDYYLKC